MDISPGVTRLTGESLGEPDRVVLPALEASVVDQKQTKAAIGETLLY